MFLTQFTIKVACYRRYHHRSADSPLRYRLCDQLPVLWCAMLQMLLWMLFQVLPGFQEEEEQAKILGRPV